MIKKVIIAGGRDFLDRGVMHQAVSNLVENGIIDSECELVCGMAKGADLTAYELYGAKGENKFYADWKNLSKLPCKVKTNSYGEYNALAGMNRNNAMAAHSEGLVAFWDGKSTGTKNMINTMTGLGKPVYVFDYNGLRSNTQQELVL